VLDLPHFAPESPLPRFHKGNVEELIPRIRAVCPTVRNHALFDLSLRFEVFFESQAGNSSA